MKKINCAILTSFCLLTITSFAQKQTSSFGITAGVTLPSYKVKQEGVSLTGKTKAGFTVGVTTAVPLGQNFGFMPALNFTQKGGKVEEEFLGERFTDELTLNYLELPLNFVYNTNSAKGKFFIGAGPSLAFGLSGKDKWESGTEKGSDDIKFGSGEDDDLKAFEAGINVLTGYQFAGGFFIAANYNVGLSNIAIGSGDENGKMHNNYFGFRIGIMFGPG
jgi:hypothetical protein